VTNTGKLGFENKNLNPLAIRSSQHVSRRGNNLPGARRNRRHNERRSSRHATKPRTTATNGNHILPRPTYNGRPNTHFKGQSKPLDKHHHRHILHRFHPHRNNLKPHNSRLPLRHTNGHFSSHSRSINRLVRMEMAQTKRMTYTRNSYTIH
jgi:hypothetical protein